MEFFCDFLENEKTRVIFFAYPNKSGTFLHAKS
jgi:hypothetical protein